MCYGWTSLNRFEIIACQAPGTWTENGLEWERAQQQQQQTSHTYEYYVSEARTMKDAYGFCFHEKQHTTFRLRCAASQAKTTINALVCLLFEIAAVSLIAPATGVRSALDMRRNNRSENRLSSIGISICAPRVQTRQQLTATVPVKLSQFRAEVNWIFGVSPLLWPSNKYLRHTLTAGAFVFPTVVVAWLLAADLHANNR